MPGFSTDAERKTGALLVGAGGLGSAIAVLTVRKGIGRLHICDDDVVEVSNLNRQTFFAEDLYQPKALRLAKNASREGFFGTLCIGHEVAFGPESAEILAQGIDVAIVGVDNEPTRAFASRFFRERRIPVLFTAVNESANYGYVFVDEPEGPCLACVFPEVATSQEARPCRPSPAVVDILHVVGGIVTYAVDSLIMNRRREWSFHAVDLTGTVGDEMGKVRRRPGCLLCGNAKK